LKKKILVLSSTFPRWENDHEPPFVYELSKKLTEKYDVHVLAPHTMGSKTYEILQNMPVHRFKYAPESIETLAYNGGISTNLRLHPLRYLLVFPFIITELFSAIRIIRKEKIDLIHAHWIIPQGLVAIIASAAVRIHPKTLVTAHGADVYTRTGGVISSLKRFILNRCDHLTVVSQGMADTVQLLKTKCNVDIIPMGTDLTHVFVPDSSKRKKPQLVFVGRLVEKKGVKYLIDGFQQLNSQYPDLTLIIVGHGPEKESLHEYAYHLGISEKVEFIGGLPQEEIPAYFQQSSVAVFPFIRAEDGDQEGFGLVLVESMGCGCATITTDLPAVRDIISDRVTGLYIGEKNSNNIVARVSELLEDNVLREKLSENGREFVVSNYDWSVIAKSYKRVIACLLDKQNILP
jgi:glycosyltransferase involved in cell wall biosynthesis